MAAFPSQENLILKRSRSAGGVERTQSLGPPDVYRQIVGQDEDCLNEGNVREGYKLSFLTGEKESKEYRIECNNALDYLKEISAADVNSSFCSIVAKKADLSTLPDTSKKKIGHINKDIQLIPKNQDIINSWFRDLALGAPLVNLSKRVPLSITKKDDNLRELVKQRTPISRAIWYLKVWAQFYLGFLESNKKKGRIQTDLPHEFKVDLCNWLSSLIKQIIDLLERDFASANTIIHEINGDGESASRFSKTKSEWDYLFDLLEAMMVEGLVDQGEVLNWMVADLLEKLPASDLALRFVMPYVLRLVPYYSLNEMLARRLLHWAAVSMAELVADSSDCCAAGGPQNAAMTTHPQKAEVAFNSLMEVYSQTSACPLHRNILMGLGGIVSSLVLQIPAAAVWTNVLPCVKPSMTDLSSFLHGSPLDILPCELSHLPIPNCVSETEEFTPNIIGGGNGAVQGNETIRNLSQTASDPFNLNNCQNKFEPSLSPIGTSQAPKIRRALALVERDILERSTMAEECWSKRQFSLTRVITTRLIEVLECLDKYDYLVQSEDNNLESLFNEVFSRDDRVLSTDLCIVGFLCEWVVSSSRSGTFRPVIAAALLEMLISKYGARGSLPAFDIAKDPFQEVLVQFLDKKAPLIHDYPATATAMTSNSSASGAAVAGGGVSVSNSGGGGDGNNSSNLRHSTFFSGEVSRSFRNLVAFFGELIDREVFSHDAYVRYLIARGELSTEHQPLGSGSSAIFNLTCGYGLNHSLNMAALSAVSGAPGGLLLVDENTRSPDTGGMDSAMSDASYAGQNNCAWDASTRRLPRHVQYMVHFPFPQDESFSHEMNQRSHILYGTSRAKDAAVRNMRRIARDVAKLYQKKMYLLDMSTGQMAKMRKTSRSSYAALCGGASGDATAAASSTSGESAINEVLNEETRRKFTRLNYYDMEAVVAQVTPVLLDCLRRFASHPSSSNSSSSGSGSLVENSSIGASAGDPTAAASFAASMNMAANAMNFAACSGSSTYLPIPDNISFFFDLIELSLNFTGLLSTVVKVVTTLVSAEARMINLSPNPNMAKTYLSSLCLNSVGILRRHQAVLMTMKDTAKAAFWSLVTIVRSVGDPANCASPERVILAYLHDLFEASSEVRDNYNTFFQKAHGKVDLAIFRQLEAEVLTSAVPVSLFFDSTPAYPFASGAGGGDDFGMNAAAALEREEGEALASTRHHVCAYLPNFISEAALSEWVRGQPAALGEQTCDTLDRRYSFMTNAILFISGSVGCLERPMEHVEQVAHLCAEITSNCSDLPAEWLGALYAAVCPHNAAAGFPVIRRRVRADDPHYHDRLTVLIAVLLARHCFTVDSLMENVIILVLASALTPDDASDSMHMDEEDSDSALSKDTNMHFTGHSGHDPKLSQQRLNDLLSIRLVCHIVFRLFTCTPYSRSSCQLFIRGSTEPLLLEGALQKVKPENMLDALKFLQRVSDSQREERSCRMRANFIENLYETLNPQENDPTDVRCMDLGDFAANVIKEICSVAWVREKFLRERSALLSESGLRDADMGASQARQLLRTICRPLEQQISDSTTAASFDPTATMNLILAKLDVWSLATHYMELDLLVKQQPLDQQAGVLEALARAVVENLKQRATSFLSFTNEPGIPRVELAETDPSWLVAPLVAHLPVQLQAAVVHSAATELGSGNDFWSTKNNWEKESLMRRSSVLLAHPPFVTLLLECLRCQNTQDELLAALRDQIEMFVSNAKEVQSIPDDLRIRQVIQESLQLRLGLVGSLFDVIRNDKDYIQEWALLFAQLITNNVVELSASRELFNTVLDMLVSLLHNLQNSEENRKIYYNLAKKIKKEIGELQDENISFLKTLLPVARPQFEVLCVAPHRSLVKRNTGERLSEFSAAGRQLRQGYQLRMKERLNPWEVVEGFKNVQALSMSWFGAVRAERTVLRYVEAMASSLLAPIVDLPFHTKSYYLEAPPLPEEELAPDSTFSRLVDGAVSHSNCAMDVTSSTAASLKKSALEMDRSHLSASTGTASSSLTGAGNLGAASATKAETKRAPPRKSRPKKPRNSSPAFGQTTSSAISVQRPFEQASMYSTLPNGPLGSMSAVSHMGMSAQMLSNNYPSNVDQSSLAWNASYGQQMRHHQAPPPPPPALPQSVVVNQHPGQTVTALTNMLRTRKPPPSMAGYGGMPVAPASVVPGQTGQPGMVVSQGLQHNQHHQVRMQLQDRIQNRHIAPGMPNRVLTAVPNSASGGADSVYEYPSIDPSAMYGASTQYGQQAAAAAVMAQQRQQQQQQQFNVGGGAPGYHSASNEQINAQLLQRQQQLPAAAYMEQTAASTQTNLYMHQTQQPSNQQQQQQQQQQFMLHHGAMSMGQAPSQHSHAPSRSYNSGY